MRSDRDWIFLKMIFLECVYTWHSEKRLKPVKTLDLRPYFSWHSLGGHWFFSLISRDIRRYCISFSVDDLNSWVTLDWGVQSSDGKISMKFKMILPGFCADCLIIDSKSMPFVVPHPNGQSGVSGHLVAPWSVTIGKHAICFPFQNNLNAHKKFE
jgi:hypothetical protein